jgi:hypothetical protein
MFTWCCWAEPSKPRRTSWTKNIWFGSWVGPHNGRGCAASRSPPTRSVIPIHRTGRCRPDTAHPYLGQAHYCIDFAFSGFSFFCAVFLFGFSIWFSSFDRFFFFYSFEIYLYFWEIFKFRKKNRIKKFKFWNCSDSKLVKFRKLFKFENCLNFENCSDSKIV